jgi:toxin HigB-1
MYPGTVQWNAVIVDFRDSWLEDFFRHDKTAKRIPADAAARVFRKLQLIDDAATDADLRAPPSNHFEKLSGSMQGWHSIRVSDSWRLVFRWSSRHGEARGVYLDNHTYR